MSLDPVSIGLTVGSMLMQKMSSDSQRRRQDALVDQMTQYRSQKSKESENAINKFTSTLEPGAQDERTAAINAGLTDNFNSALMSAKGVEKPENIAGKFGPDYTNRVASNKARVANDVTTAFKNLAAIGTPGQRGVQDSLNYGQAATDVAANNQAANNVSARYETGIKNQGTDPFLDLASTLLSGANMARGMTLAKGTVQPSNVRLRPGGGQGLRF